ncbi:MAG: CDP-diacylglycerol--glycerol-3-phosphate 3-phosphatidyltransferase [Lachnospiraceae bacterium]|nr:CDP-diacylglycerol--glycerol-3-phosphate 3-phosphatidyltransferase [Lachnospiraceae bacterium]
MNIPNQLTILRILMIPVFLVFMLGQGIPYHNWIAFTIFIVASLTDLFDGIIARKYNLVTNFGKFMDPLADKLLVCSALIALIELGRIMAWMVILIIFREFIISGFRLVAADNGVVIAASFWGKLKTIVQTVMVCMLIIVDDFAALVFLLIKIDVLSILRILTEITIWAAIILTVVSLVDYLAKNWQVMK